MIPRILERAAGDDKLVVPFASHPLDLLRGWMQDLSVEEERPRELIVRRNLAVQLAKRFFEGGGARHLAIRVLLMALSPKLYSTSRDPGAGRTLTQREGVLLPETLREIEAIWEQGRKVIDEIDFETWSLLKTVLWEWTQPVPVRSMSKAEERLIRDALHSLARKVLAHLAPLATGSPGLAADLTRLASRVGFQLQLTTDPQFDLLYTTGIGIEADWFEREAAVEVALEELAARWGVEWPPQEVAQTLLRYERDAKIAQSGPRRTPELCRLLAERVTAPERWVETFLDHQLAADMLLPFLEAMVATRPEGWEKLLERCLGLEPWVSVRVILQLQEPPAQFLEAALGKAIAFPELIENLSLCKKIPVPTLQALLGHPNAQLALAAAVGEWHGEPRGEVREEMRGVWRRATLQVAEVGDEHVIAGSNGFGYWLGEILSGDPELAFEWLGIFLKRAPEPALVVRDTVVKAVDALREEHRLSILERLEPGSLADLLLPSLVGRKTAVYSKLLELNRLKDDHLRPLAGLPDVEWAKLARMALEVGHEPRAIAQACFLGKKHAVRGDGQEYWSQWDRAFAELKDDPDDDLREVARYGRELARENIKVGDLLAQLDGRFE